MNQRKGVAGGYLKFVTKFWIFLVVWSIFWGGTYYYHENSMYITLWLVGLVVGGAIALNVAMQNIVQIYESTEKAKWEMKHIAVQSFLMGEALEADAEAKEFKYWKENYIFNFPLDFNIENVGDVVRIAKECQAKGLLVNEYYNVKETNVHKEHEQYQKQEKN